MSDCGICGEPGAGPLCVQCATPLPPSPGVKEWAERQQAIRDGRDPDADQETLATATRRRAADYQIVTVTAGQPLVPQADKPVPVDSNSWVAILPVGDEDAYTPKRDEPLFREFAALDSTQKYRNFALGYGLLGVPPRHIVMKDGTRVIAEPLDAWALEVSQLCMALTAWDLLRGYDVYEDAEDDLLGQQARGTGPQRQRRLAKIVTDTFNGAIARQLHRHSATSTVASLIPSIEIIPGTLDFASRLRPSTLIDAIWDQAWRAIKGWTADYTFCRCGEPIQHPPTKRGPRQKSCSNKCRTLFDQKDEALARRMVRESPRIARSAIMKATGLNEDRVKKIIIEERERRAKGAR